MDDDVSIPTKRAKQLLAANAAAPTSDVPPSVWLQEAVRTMEQEALQVQRETCKDIIDKIAQLPWCTDPRPRLEAFLEFMGELLIADVETLLPKMEASPNDRAVIIADVEARLGRPPKNHIEVCEALCGLRHGICADATYRVAKRLFHSARVPLEESTEPKSAQMICDEFQARRESAREGGTDLYQKNFFICEHSNRDDTVWQDIMSTWSPSCCMESFVRIALTRDYPEWWRVVASASPLVVVAPSMWLPRVVRNEREHIARHATYAPHSPWRGARAMGRRYRRRVPNGAVSLGPVLPHAGGSPHDRESDALHMHHGDVAACRSPWPLPRLRATCRTPPSSSASVIFVSLSSHGRRPPGGVHRFATSTTTTTHPRLDFAAFCLVIAVSTSRCSNNAPPLASSCSTGCRGAGR